MPLPHDLVLVRHGQSEANVIQKLEKAGKTTSGRDRERAKAIFGRHDSQQRLTDDGRDQAARAGAWLADNRLSPGGFTGRFASPFNRTLETASILDPETDWIPEARLVERDWGEYGSTPEPERTELYPGTERMRKASAFFARLSGGESVFDSSFRVRDFLGMCAREYADERVIAVAHGELMWAMRFIIKRLMPHEWEALDDDENMRLGNCTVLQYTRIDPGGSGEVAGSLSSGWRRITDPVEGKSPYGGEWVRLPGKRHLDRAEINAVIDRSPPLLSDGHSRDECDAANGR